MARAMNILLRGGAIPHTLASPPRIPLGLIASVAIISLILYLSYSWGSVWVNSLGHNGLGRARGYDRSTSSQLHCRSLELLIATFYNVELARAFIFMIFMSIPARPAEIDPIAKVRVLMPLAFIPIVSEVTGSCATALIHTPSLVLMRTR